MNTSETTNTKVNENIPELTNLIENEIMFTRASVKHAEEMNMLNRKCLPENYPLSMWKNVLLFQNEFSFVAMYKNVLVGYVFGIVMMKEDNEVIGGIASLAVDKNYRRMHIGFRLLEKAVESFRKVNMKTLLNVRVSNVNAQNLYKKVGFKTMKTLDKYYDNEDAYEMIYQHSNVPKTKPMNINSNAKKY